MQSTGTPSDGTVLPASIASSGNFSFPQLTVTGTSSLGDDVTFTGANYNAVWDKSDNALEFADNAKLRLGTGNDLEIYHDGSKSVIADTGTGGLFIGGSSISLTNSGISETMLYAVPDGAVELYYDNSKKLETTSTGVSITGNITASGGQLTLEDGNEEQIHRFWNNISDSDIHGLLSGSTFGTIVEGANNGHHVIALRGNDTSDSFAIISGGGNYTTDSTYDTLVARFYSNGVFHMPDNNSIKLGTSNDLQIYHDGSHSRIDDTGTGSLVLRSSHFLVEKYGGDYMISGAADGAVELYYDNSKKFETTSGGVTVTGTLIADGLTLYDNEKLLIGNNTDIEVFHDGTNSIFQSDTGDLQINSGNSAGNVEINLVNNVGNNTREASAKFIKNGGVELYYDNSKKLKTISEGIKVTELQIAPSGTESNALINFGGGGVVTNSNSYGHFYDRATGGTNTTAVMFRSAGSQVGKIIFNNTETLYQSGSSDRTLKKNFENWTETILTSFKNLNPQKFNYIQEEDTDAKHKGYIAQDLADKFPEAYPKDPETDKYGFNPSGMVVYLMKAIQELEAKVAALEAA
jgi:hypothetical protein